MLNKAIQPRARNFPGHMEEKHSRRNSWNYLISKLVLTHSRFSCWKNLIGSFLRLYVFNSAVSWTYFTLIFYAINSSYLLFKSQRLTAYNCCLLFSLNIKLNMTDLLVLVKNWNLTMQYNSRAVVYFFYIYPWDRAIGFVRNDTIKKRR